MDKFQTGHENMIVRVAELTMFDGDGAGLIEAGFQGWTGAVLSAPRFRAAALTSRSELRRPGVYILLAPDPDDAHGLVTYVGQAVSNVGRRVAQHAAADVACPGWTHVIATTDLRTTWNHSQVLFLEGMLIALASTMPTLRLVNKKGGGGAIALSSAERLAVTSHLERLRILLPLLTVTLRQGVPRKLAVNTASRTRADRKTIFTFAHKGIAARGWPADGKSFVVAAGSQCAARPTSPRFQTILEQLRMAGEVEPTDDPKRLRFTRDRAFRSPTMAASVLCGYAQTGGACG